MTPRHGRREDEVGDNAIVGKSILINRPRDELFAFWSDFQNLSAFMENLEQVERDGEAWRWTIKAPLGQDVELETEITELVPNEVIGWASTDRSQIKTTGRIEFSDAPAGRGTVATLDLAYDPPAGNLGRLVAKLFGREPNIQARQELKRFKMLMEAGEIAKGPDQLEKDE